MGRAELYLCVLRQLVLLYGASPQYSSSMQRTYFPKLVQVSLDVLTNTTQQVPSSLFTARVETTQLLFF